MENNNNTNAVKKLIDIGIRPVSLCEQFAAMYPESHIDEVIATGKTRAKTSISGWVRKALQENWVIAPVIPSIPKPTPEERRQQAIADNARNRQRMESSGTGGTW